MNQESLLMRVPLDVRGLIIYFFDLGTMTTLKCVSKQYRQVIDLNEEHAHDIVQKSKWFNALARQGEKWKLYNFDSLKRIVEVGRGYTNTFRATNGNLVCGQCKKQIFVHTQKCSSCSRRSKIGRPCLRCGVIQCARTCKSCRKYKRQHKSQVPKRRRKSRVSKRQKNKSSLVSI